MYGVFGRIGKLIDVYIFALPTAGPDESGMEWLQIELGSRLTKEKPRNHLDMRHRLDSEGKRYGRMIDYK